MNPPQVLSDLATKVHVLLDSPLLSIVRTSLPSGMTTIQMHVSGACAAWEVLMAREQFVPPFAQILGEPLDSEVLGEGGEEQTITYVL